MMGVGGGGGEPSALNLFFPVLFLFDWVGVLWPNYVKC